METKTIIIPSMLTSITGVNALRLTSLDLRQYDQCLFDFSRCRFGEPLPMLILAHLINRLRQRFPEKTYIIRTRNSDFRGYAEHIGFFRYMGFPRGNRPGEAQGTRNYTPIEVLNLEELREASGGRPYAEIIIEKANRLAKVLTGEEAGDLFVSLSYALREIMRNAIEHSLGDELVVCGQYWPAIDKAEIVVLDNGVGIKATFDMSGNYEFASDSEAIVEALRPGVTSVTEAEKLTQDEMWRNSGFGMYVTSRYCGERGYFRAISGNSGISINNRGTTSHDWNFPGTCIQMVLENASKRGGAKRIEEIIEEGEAELAEQCELGERSASRGSKSIFV